MSEHSSLAVLVEYGKRHGGVRIIWNLASGWEVEVGPHVIFWQDDCTLDELAAYCLKTILERAAKVSSIPPTEIRADEGETY